MIFIYQLLFIHLFQILNIFKFTYKRRVKKQWKKDKSQTNAGKWNFADYTVS